MIQSAQYSSGPPPAVPAAPQPAAATPSLSASTPAVAISVPTLAYQPPAAVQAAIGVRPEVTPITRSPEMMPGEWHNYTLPGGGDLMVTFYRGRAVSFQLQLPAGQGFSTPEQMLGTLGINAAGLAVASVNSTTTIWSGPVGGLYYDRLSATTGSLHSRTYGHAAARLRGSPLGHGGGGTP